MNKALAKVSGAGGSLGLSSRQTFILGAGVVAALVACFAAVTGRETLKDVAATALILVLLTFSAIVLRTITARTSSLRNDIKHQSQGQARITNRLDLVLGSSLTIPPVTGIVGSTLGRSGGYFGVGPEYEYAQRAVLDLGVYEAFALRTRSQMIRSVLARSVTGLQFNYPDLLRVVTASASITAENSPAVFTSWNKSSLTALARVVANQRLRPDDNSAAIKLYSFCERVFGASSLGRTDRQLYIECLLADGDWEQVRTKLQQYDLARKNPVHASLILANIANTDGNGGLWERHVNSVLNVDKLSPLSVAPGAAAVIDRIICRPYMDGVPRSSARPLVSVIVPTRNGANFIETAIRSLVCQTWTDVEILVADDGSDEHQLVALREICARYRGLTLIELPQNRGAYEARNAALEHARGDFVTVHDDDDWSHPEKIERQVAALLSDPTLPASMSQHCRVTESMQFLRTNINLNFVQPNYSSVMVRRSVLDEIGGWDTVNRGADAEFLERINSRYPRGVDIVGESPLSFTRTRVGSLTHGEIDRGYIEPARLLYQQAYRHAHAVQRTMADDGRQFAAPMDMLPGHRGKPKGHFDVVYAADFRSSEPTGSTIMILGEIKAAVEAGLRVAVLQLESALKVAEKKYPPVVLDFFLERDIAILRLRDEYHASLLVLRSPTILQYLDTPVSGAQIDRCVLIVDVAPVKARGSGAVYDLRDCLTNARHCFSVEVLVTPESGLIRQLMTSFDTSLELTDFDWMGVVDSFEPFKSQRAGKKPTVGRHTWGARAEWPDSAGPFIAAYDHPEVFDTHVYGSMDEIFESLPAEVMSRICVSTPDEMGLAEYFGSIDFWVYSGSDCAMESLSVPAAQAVAAGLVVVLPPYMASTFRESAVYADPTEVVSVVTEHWHDAGKYERQCAAARTFARNNYSRSSYTRRLEDLMMCNRSSALS